MAEQSSAPSVARTSATPDSLNSDCLSGILSALAYKHRVPGAQLAIHRGGETVAVECGERQYGTGRQVTRDGAFPIGSITKICTATVAMILVADGDLDLDLPLWEYRTEYRCLDVPITLRQLLSHTSGFASEVDSDGVSSSSIRRYVVEHCRRENRVSPPGVGFSYSNVGYVLVGHLIEKVTGMSWWEAVESIVLQPLGIAPTFVVGAGSFRPDRPMVTGHSVNRAVGRTKPVPQSLTPAMAPAGALAVSAVDLVKFGRAFVEERVNSLLPAAYARQMRQPETAAEPFGLADGWGLGLALFDSPDTTWVGHDGNSDGTACYLRADPHSGCVIAFTSNANIGLDMWQELVTELGRLGLPIMNYSTAELLGAPTPPPAGCLGSYLNGDTEYSVEAGEDGNFYFLVDGTPVARLSFQDGLFFSQHDLASGEFEHAGRFLRDPSTGCIDHLQTCGRLACRRVLPTDEIGRRRSLARASSF